MAIKVLSKARVWGLGALQNIRHEKVVLLEVSHPRIVNLYGTMQDEESVYLIMEFVPGGELFSHLCQMEYFDIPTTRYYVAQLVTAIARLHSVNIAYRDIKPENLLLDAQGQLKLTDFGFARRMEDLSVSSCGTPEYLAPEQIRSEKHGMGVDWWGIGILTYEMLEGVSPFQADNIADVYKMALNYAPCFVNTTDPTTVHFIRRLLAKDCSKRLGCGAEGAEEVKKHPFFAGIDWKSIEFGLEEPPIHITISHTLDTTNFVVESTGKEEEALLPVNTGPINQAEFEPYF